MSDPPLRLTAPGRLLPWPAVRQMVGISRTTAWRLQNAGAFPLPVVISAGRIGWREEDIVAWTESLASSALRRRKMATPPARQPTVVAASPPARVPPPAPSRRGAKSGAQQLGFDFEA